VPLFEFLKSYGRLFAPLRHHSKVVEVFLQLLVLLQGENDRDPERELIDNVTGSALNVANLLTSLWCAGTINLRSLRRVGRVLIRSRELSGTLREDHVGPGLYRPQPDDRLVRLLRALRPDQILNRAASFALTPGSVPRLHSPTLATGRVTCQRTGEEGGGGSGSRLHAQYTPGG
jgi:hypothetical protein